VVDMTIINVIPEALKNESATVISTALSNEFDGQEDLVKLIPKFSN